MESKINDRIDSDGKSVPERLMKTVVGLCDGANINV